MTERRVKYLGKRLIRHPVGGDLIWVKVWKIEGLKNFEVNGNG